MVLDPLSKTANAYISRVQALPEGLMRDILLGASLSSVRREGKLFVVYVEPMIAKLASAKAKEFRDMGFVVLANGSQNARN